jgi:hypothetical protein
MPVPTRSPILRARCDNGVFYKEVKFQLAGPLAAGVTLGGMLLDALVPRPKPRAGPAPDTSPAGAGCLEDTGNRVKRHDGPPAAERVLPA